MHMNFTDYEEHTIILSDESWIQHIQINHPEITQSDIQRALLDPDIVVKSRHKENVKLYYRSKITSSGKSRFTQVVVKFCSDGIFVSTAMTVNKSKQGIVLMERSNKS